MLNMHPHCPNRFDQLRKLFRRTGADSAFRKCRDGPGDAQTKLAADLFWVAKLWIQSVEQNCQRDGSTQTAEYCHKKQARRRVSCRTKRSDRRVKHAHVGSSTCCRQLRLGVATLQSGVQPFLYDYSRSQTHFFNCSGWNRLKLSGRALDSGVVFAFALPQLDQEARREERNRLRL